VNRDFVLGCAALALAVAYYLAAAAIPDTLLSDAIGPQGLPKIYAVVLSGLALILIGGSLRTMRKPERVCATGSESVRELDASGASATLDASVASPIGLARPLGMLVIGVLYVIVVPWLGYVPTIALLIAGTTYYQGGMMSGRVAITAIAGAIGLWLLFVALLHIPQPAGFRPW